MLARWANKPIWFMGLEAIIRHSIGKIRILGINWNYNLRQNKWNIWTTPPRHFNNAIWRVFAPSRLHHCFVPFYSVQDCSLQLRIMS